MLHTTNNPAKRAEHVANRAELLHGGWPTYWLSVYDRVLREFAETTKEEVIHEN